jgi:hypothetical protein
VNRLDELMHEVGLINITKETFKVPIGSWGEKAGELFAKDYRLGSIALQALFTNTLGVPKEEADKNCILMVEEFESYQAYTTIHVYFGQKQ